jgi:hypothetical protein
VRAAANALGVGALSGSLTEVDRQGFVRRETYKENLTLKDQETNIESSIELYDFGAPVIAPLPPAVEVTDLTGASKGTQS